MRKFTQKDTDLWEIWIEFDQFHPQYFGTLYVHGEVLAGKKSVAALTRVQGAHRHELALQLPSSSADENAMREVFYSEPVSNLNQYTTVSIYYGRELLRSFVNIEVLI